MAGPLSGLEVTSTPALLSQALDKHLRNLIAHSDHSDRNGGSYDSSHWYLVGLWPSKDQRMQSWWEASDYMGEESQARRGQGLVLRHRAVRAKTHPQPMSSRVRGCSHEPSQITSAEMLCNWKFCTNTTCSNLAQPPHLARRLVSICCLSLLFRLRASPSSPQVGNPPELRGVRPEGFPVCRPEPGKLPPGLAKPGAPRSQETPAQALTGRGVPCLLEADEISFAPRYKQVGERGGCGCDGLKGLRTGLGAGDWQRLEVKWGAWRTSASIEMETSQSLDVAGTPGIS